MCQAQKKHLNASAEMFLRDQGKAKALRALSAQCGDAALTSIHTSKGATKLFVPPASLLQGCKGEVAGSMLAAGKALEQEASSFTTVFAKEAFGDAVKRASPGSALPALLASGKDWPSKAEPKSKAKGKAASACKMAQGIVNCGLLKSQLDTFAVRLEEQKNAAVTNQRKQ